MKLHRDDAAHLCVTTENEERIYIANISRSKWSMSKGYDNKMVLFLRNCGPKPWVTMYPRARIRACLYAAGFLANFSKDRAKQPGGSDARRLLWRSIMAAHPPKNCRHVYLEMYIDIYGAYTVRDKTVQMFFEFGLLLE